MEEWMSMRVMKGAHDEGLQRLDDLIKAAGRLKEGEKAEAIEVFDAVAQFFEKDLSVHFRHEEQALFPVLAKKIGRAGPIDAMVEEHDSIWHAIDSFGELLTELKGADPTAQAGLVPNIERVAAHIVWILSSHIQKENSMLFPLAEKMLDHAGRQEVDANIDTLARLSAA